MEKPSSNRDFPLSHNAKDSDAKQLDQKQMKSQTTEREWKSTKRKGKKKFLKIDCTPCYCPQCSSDVKISASTTSFDSNMQSLFNSMSELPDIERVKDEIKSLEASQKRAKIQQIMKKIEFLENEIVKTRNDIVNVVKMMGISRSNPDNFITNQNFKVIF